jgi:hypothetical protein
MPQDNFEFEASPSTIQQGIARRLDAAGWGLFFIWVGVSLLADLGWGVGLVGVSAIIFLGQAARRFYGRTLEIFWVAVGVLSLLGGIRELYQIELDLGPVLLIVIGGALLLAPFRRRRRTDRRHPSIHWCDRCLDKKSWQEVGELDHGAMGTQP